ncbi:NAD(P)-binding domain-containing protein [Allokutzneria sp. A3M-2-11 16]|uniref:NAD(P)-dependent oxidoreductase n=1 Tax=Allokutzneria sp. A3M-2-11 16 TaxID=2962043 RepID=UPI0020B7B72E|nr:NAD(P)-binding domain-containing protein [Allokutzneria sp. A3M-2-11 16]MCP3802720.1 NAD(P)-binding domain-containing protein [Allokutzneria sp. A3M-2-11 16]
MSKIGVTLIGLGPMGQAMVRKLLAGDHAVTVWNRTASRADALVSEGAVRAADVGAALAANNVVILSLTDYQAMYDILGTATDALAGKVVVNLSSDTPGKTREAAAWLAGHGAELLTGGVMVPADLVGEEGAYVFYSGSRTTFDQYAPMLSVIGRPDYVGEDITLAQLYYQAQLDIFLTSLSAYLHATALLNSAGVSAESFRHYAADNFAGISMYLEGAAKQIDEGNHPGDLASVVMMGATADHIVGASEEAGIETGLPRAVKAHYDRAIESGHGADSWTSLIERIKKP